MNPSAGDTKKLLRIHNQVTKIPRKLWNWFHTCSIIQGLKTFPIPCWHFQEAFAIKNQSKCAKNWRTRAIRFALFSNLTYHHSCAFNHFSCLIYTNSDLLKRLVQFNWINVAWIKIHHGRNLGFLKLQIRALDIRKNWIMPWPWLNSSRPYEFNQHIAPFLCWFLFYSLFFTLSLSGGLKPPLSCSCLQVKRRRQQAWQHVIGWFE